MGASALMRGFSKKSWDWGGSPPPSPCPPAMEKPVVFTIIFFPKTLWITLILDERYMYYFMKIQNNSPPEYIVYSLASYYLIFIGLGI